jgi:hypothetical protein
MSPKAQEAADQVVATEAVSDVATDGEHALEELVVDFDDGPITFVRPGVEEMTFQVKDGKISTTKERRNWLLTHVVGTGPSAE